MRLESAHCLHTTRVALSGRNEMDPPLCGSTAISHNEFKIREPMEPQEASPMKQEMSVLGIDIAKRVFHAIGMDNTGKIVFRKRFSRHDLMPCMAKLPPVRIGMEACGGAHDWARHFHAYGPTRSSSWPRNSSSRMSSRTKTTAAMPRPSRKP